MMELVFATNNAHKLREVCEIIGNSAFVRSLREVDFEKEIPETADTLAGNAIQKARFVYEGTGHDCFADDTGLEIESLGGRPGVYSARYAGEDCSFDDNIRKVLKEMEGVDNRKASFRCVICLIREGKEYLFEGRVDGIILGSRRGKDGFGYDPVFLPDGYEQSFAEMSPELKNRISHRGEAVQRLLEFIKKG
jgi:XTP/dITP diphosphohydrolase